MHRLLLLGSLFCLVSLASCLPAPASPAWCANDLRLLDPLDDTPTPSTDILAVYTRIRGSDLEIRVDLLDLPLVPDYHLVFRLDSISGGDPWDWTVDVPAAGKAVVQPASSAIIPRIIRNPWLDYVTLRINRLSIRQPFTLQVETYQPGSSTPADETGSLRSDALPPIQRAALVIAFREVFASATPAQALRSWSGAHTGPDGGRHGLKYILDAVEETGIPVTLLDLKIPSSLAAMDALNLTARVRNLEQQNLLLPDVGYGNPVEVSLKISRTAAQGFGLGGSLFVYTPFASLQEGYAGQFLRLDDSTHAAASGGLRLFPLPAEDAHEATPEGPSLAVRRALVESVYSEDRTALVVLGGDLPRSTWGNEDSARPTFAWIAAHPWIQPLTGEQMMSVPARGQITAPRETAQVIHSIPSSLLFPADNPITTSAWNAWFMLNAPTADPSLAALKEQYLGVVSALLAASTWAEHPSAWMDCGRDLDQDRQPECVLADSKVFAILDPSGARLSFLFVRIGSKPHQLVGPSSQFAVGLSDPSLWQPGQGDAADPNVLSGAFVDDHQPQAFYSFTILPGAIQFVSPDGSLTKTYSLLDGGIEVSYASLVSLGTRIPLAMDPQEFFSAPTRYLPAVSAGQFTWELNSGITAEILSTAALKAQSFTDSLSDLPPIENPDFNYPTGHYLPFPLAVITVQSSGDFSVRIQIKQ